MKRSFRYEAINAGGTAVDGVVSALDEADALAQLQTQALTPVSLVVSAPVRSGGHRKHIPETEKIMVVRELATLLRAGIPLADAVQSLADAREGSALGNALQRGVRTLNAGQPFVAALDDAKIDFPPFVMQLAATGEMTGKLAGALLDAARQMEYDAKVRQDLRNSLTYPVILMGAGISAVLVIFLFVIPRFANLVRGSRAASMPEISMWVINTGVFLQTNLTWVALATLTCVALIAHSLRDTERRTQWLARLIRVPLIGVWLIEAEIGRWATTLGTLLNNRVPILGALELSTQSLRFPAMKRNLQLVIRDVRAGATLAESVAKHSVVNATGVNLIRVGEKSGELAQMVATLGELYSEAGRNRMVRFLLMLEPAAILIIGGVIGFLMVTIMMALTSLNPGTF